MASTEDVNEEVCPRCGWRNDAKASSCQRCQRDLAVFALQQCVACKTQTKDQAVACPKCWRPMVKRSTAGWDPHRGEGRWSSWLKEHEEELSREMPELAELTELNDLFSKPLEPRKIPTIDEEYIQDYIQAANSVRESHGGGDLRALRYGRKHGLAEGKEWFANLVRSPQSTEVPKRIVEGYDLSASEKLARGLGWYVGAIHSGGQCPC